MKLARLFSVALCLCAAAPFCLCASAPPSSARELLATFGIDAGLLAQLADDRPWNDEESLVLLRCLLRSGQLPPADMERLARQPERAALERDSAGQRGEFFRLRGRVESVAREAVPAELARRFEFDHYYRCRLNDERWGPAEVYARDVPRAWLERERLDEPAGAVGVFLKRQAGPPPAAALVAPRVAWYPDTLLGRLGMDVGLLDEVRNRTGLTGRDREAFYQMLGAAGRAADGQLLAAAEEQLRRARRDSDSVVPLFNQADQQRGRLVVLDGVARRAIRIDVDEPDVAARFGLRQYYEIALFTADSQDNPLFFCLRELPPGMPPGDGPHYAQRIRVAGFFFKTWAYRSAESDQRSEDSFRSQLAPLLIGRDAVLAAAPPPADPMPRAILAAIVAAGVLLAGWSLWRTNRRRPRALPERIDIVRTPLAPREASQESESK